MADFLTAYNITNKTEGGYANVVGDSGGETYGGISRNNFPHWKGWLLVDAHKPLKQGQVINDPNLEQAKKDFYQNYFWLAISGDKIPNQDLANQVYDMAVNAGVNQALKLLNEC